MIFQKQSLSVLYGKAIEKAEKSVIKINSENYQLSSSFLHFLFDLLTGSECSFSWMFYSYISDQPWVFLSKLCKSALWWRNRTSKMTFSF